MIELIQDCLDLLAGTDDVDRIVAHIGRVARGSGIPRAIEILPRSPKLQSATLARYPDSGGPYLLTLTPASSGRPPVAALERAFGPCKRVRTRLGMPAAGIIDPVRSGRHASIAMIVTFPVPGLGEDMVAHSIALRKDSADRGSENGSE